MGIKEVDFGLDNFGKPIVLSDAESVAKILIQLLFLRPGQLPSQPYLGINISKYLYNFSDEVDVNEIKQEIMKQASFLLEFIDIPNMVIVVVPDKNDQGVLYLGVPVRTTVEAGKTILIGVKSYENRSTFNYKIVDSVTT